MNNQIDLKAAISTEDIQSVVAYFESLAWNDRILEISRLSPDLQKQLILALTPEDAAEVVEALPEETASDIIESLPPEQAADIVEEMPSDSRADLVSSLDEPETVLSEMEPEEAADTRALSSYEDDEAGGLMITEFLSYETHQTVADVIKDLRENAEQYSDFDIQYLYILNHQGNLTGVLPIRDLLFAQQSATVSDLMRQSTLEIRDDLKLEKIREHFDEISFSALPVVDRFERMVGIVTRSAIEEAQTEQAEKDYLSSQGIVGGDEIRTMPSYIRARRRLSWLAVNVLLGMVGASVISAHQDVLSSAISLSIFMPIISDLSGASGNQAVGVSIRELSLGLVRPGEILRVLAKEVVVGLFTGISLGTVIASIAYLWTGSPYMGLVVGSALCLNVILGVCLGGTIPLFLKKAGFDPALASGPMLTTTTDMCGFFMALTFAGWFVDKI